MSDKPIVGLEQFGNYRTNAGRLASNVHPGIRYCIAIASLRLPAGRLDSAALQSTLQMIDYVFVDDRPRAAELFTQLLAREADIDPAMVVQIRWLRATARGNPTEQLAAYRPLAKLRGGEFVSGMPRVLLAAGEMTEALSMARAWQPAPGAPLRPWKEEVESIVARLRGDARTALAAARAMRTYPGQAQNYFAMGLEIGALALTVRPGTPAAAPLARVNGRRADARPRREDDDAGPGPASPRRWRNATTTRCSTSRAPRPRPTTSCSRL